MKKTAKKTAEKVLAAATKKMADFTANVTCVDWMYQPQKPDAVKKLRKF